MSYGVVYLIRNTVNGKEYVGQTIQDLRERWGRHCSTGKTAISRAIRKHGRDAFTVEVLHECESRDEMNVLEAAAIIERGTLSPTGYNILPNGGPVLGGKQSPELIERRIANLRGIKRPEEFSRKLSAALKGRVITWGAKITEANKGRPVTEAQAAALSAGRGAPKPEGYAAAENNGNARLNWPRVWEIRRFYAEGGVSQESLARRFGVKQVAIGRIIRRVTWRDDPLMRPDED